MISIMQPANRRERRQACDNCRARKTKCDRAKPCSMCVGLAITCRYHDVLERKGRKSGRGPVISQLRAAMDEPFRNDQESTFQGYFSDTMSTTSSSGPQEVPQELAIDFNTVGPSGTRAGGNILKSPIIAGSPPRSLQHHDRLLSTALLAHIHVFLKHLFPIMPIVLAEDLLHDGSLPETLSPPRYASITALCAATHIQLKLDGSHNAAHVSDPAITGMMSRCTDEFILSCALKAREEYDVIEDESIDTLLSSFFLFAAYGNLDKHKHAWFYLSQCLAQCIAIGLHNEATYQELNPVEAELRRRIFWILFVTERTYCLQHAKPAILRSSIRKPQIFGSDCPSIIYGLISHISLFEMLPNDLYDWGSMNSSGGFDQAPLAASVGFTLCDAKPSKSMVESQYLDTLVTQEWLKVSMWKLSLGWHRNSHPNNGPLLPFLLPFSAGKLTMKALASVEESSRDACGIAMEQKLFDIGVCVADTAFAASKSSTPLVPDGFAVGPMDLLSALLKSLANIRGTQSHLFNVLLKRSDPILGMSSPRLLPEIPDNYYESSSPPAMSASPASTHGSQEINDNDSLYPSS